MKSIVRDDKDKKNFKWMVGMCKRFIKGFDEKDIELVKTLTCLYTSTPDSQFVIDYLPGEGKNVVVLSACSGHGFKFTSASGELAANLINQKEKPLKEFTLERLSGMKPKF